MQVETKRLIIREFDIGMAADVHLNSLDRDTRQFVPDEVFETVDEAHGAIEFLMSRYKGEEGPFVYPFLLKNGENIGYVQAVQIENGWEIGYHVAKHHTGNGYSTEAVKAFLPVIMKKLDITSIYGICHERNTASQRVLEKCDFILVHEGIGDYHDDEIMIRRYKYRI